MYTITNVEAMTEDGFATIPYEVDGTRISVTVPDGARLRVSAIGPAEEADRMLELVDRQMKHSFGPARRKRW